MKTRVITDTMFWYKMPEDKIGEIKEAYDLTIPSLVLKELCTSPNIWERTDEKFEHLKHAIQQILLHKNQLLFIDYNPFEFILLNNNYAIEPQIKHESYLKKLTEILGLDASIRQDWPMRRHDISALTTYINENLLPYQGLAKGKNRKRLISSHSTLKHTESLILRYTNMGLSERTQNNAMLPELSGDNELLLNHFDHFLRHLARSGKTMNDNDWVDVFNTAYVKKGDLYWTEDKKVLKFINGSKWRHYLYSF